MLSGRSPPDSGLFNTGELVQRQTIHNTLWLLVAIAILWWFVSSLDFGGPTADANRELPSLEFSEEQIEVIRTYLAAEPWDPQSTNEASSSRDKMCSDLRQLAAGLKRCWAYAEEKKVHHGIDVDTIADQHSAQITDDTTPDEFGRILQAFIAAIQDGHAHAKLATPHSYGFYSLPFDLLPVAEGYAAVDWPGIDSPVPKGSLIEEIGGESIQSLITARARFVSSSTQQARTSLVLKYHFLFSHKEIPVRFRDPKGELHEKICQMVLPSEEFHAAKVPSQEIEWRVIQDSVGYLRLPTFQPDNTAWKQTADADRGTFLEPTFEKLRHAFETLNEHQHLVLDLRGNEGGTDMLGQFLAGKLLPADTPYYRIESKYSPEVADLYQTAGAARLESGWGQSHESPVTTEQDVEPYNGRMYVLIDDGCFSTTDNFLACLRDMRPNTTFVGRPTQGGTGASRFLLKLKYSQAEVCCCTILVKSPNGHVIEGRGSQPDIPVTWSQENIVQGTDADLEAALQRIVATGTEKTRDNH